MLVWGMDCTLTDIPSRASKAVVDDAVVALMMKAPTSALNDDPKAEHTVNDGNFAPLTTPHVV